MSKQQAVVYIRVSTRTQAEEGVSLSVQEATCRKFAEKSGLTVAEVFPDEGESAKATDRDGLRKMLAYIAEHKETVSTLIVHKLDRLSRNTDDQYAVMSQLRRAGVELRSATENIDSTPVGKLSRSLLWAVAEFDNSVRAERIRECMVARFRDGYWPFQPPLGYVPSPGERGVPKQDPERGPQLLWAARERAAGRSYQAIAADLKCKGFRTPGGAYLGAQGLMRTLQSEFYAGTMLAFGEKATGRYEPLFSKQLFSSMRAVDLERTKPNKVRAKHNPGFPLLHTVRCSECDQPLRGSSPRGKMGVRYAYYHHTNSRCSLARSYARERVHAAFEGLLGQLKPDDRYLKLFKAVVLDVAKRRGQQQGKEVELHARRLKGLVAQRDKLVTFKINDPDDQLLSRAEYIERKQALETEIEAAEAERARTATTEVDVAKFLDRCFAAVTDPAKRWATYPTVEMKARFQSAVFPQGLQFDGEKFGTPQITPMLALQAKAGVTHTSYKRVVVPSGFEPEFSG